MTYCANVDAGRISRSNSLNMANIRLIRARNPSRPHVRSLRSPFSDSLLGPLAKHHHDNLMAEDSLSQSIRQQRLILAEMFKTAFQRLAATCAQVWGSRDKLNEVLSVAQKTMPNCKYLYAMNPKAVQISDNISSDGPIAADFGRDRSQRPYISEVGPGTKLSTIASLHQPACKASITDRHPGGDRRQRRRSRVYRG